MGFSIDWKDPMGGELETWDYALFGQLWMIVGIRRKHEIGTNGVISWNNSWPEVLARKIKQVHLASQYLNKQNNI